MGLLDHVPRARPAPAPEPVELADGYGYEDPPAVHITAEEAEYVARQLREVRVDPEHAYLPSDEEPDEDELDADRQAAIHRDLLVFDLAAYCQEAWPITDGGTRLEWSWHHSLICEVLQALFECWLRGKDDDLYLPPVVNTLFNICPGTLKSKIISVFFPTWCWLRAPHMRFTCVSVNEDISLRDARAARDVIRSPWYQQTFAPKWGLKRDQDAISNYGNTEGGVRISKASGSQIVGLRGDCLIIDDPNDPFEAEAKREREKINALWDASIYNRVNDIERCIRIGVQQRVHVDDWSGHVLAKQGAWSPTNRFGWLHVVLPAEFDPARKFSMPAVLREAIGASEPSELVVLEDPRTEAGESLHPKRWSRAALDAERKRWEGTGNYAAQMDQKPASAEGAAIKRAWFDFARLDAGVRPEHDLDERDRPRPAHTRAGEAHLVKAAHQRPGHWDLDWVELSLDPALHETDRGSAWGLVMLAGKGGRRFALDDRTERGDILAVVERMREMVKYWRPDRIIIEKKAAGESVRKMLVVEMAKGDLPPVEIVMVDPGARGKQERLDACKGVFASGMFHLLDGAPWLEAFVDELCVFPVGTKNDRVDAVTQCLNLHIEDESMQLPEM